MTAENDTNDTNDTNGSEHLDDGAVTAPQGFLPRLDAWMAENPWHPRLMPFAVYLAFLALIDGVQGYEPRTYPFLYVIQCAVVLWILWRYRKLLPELNLRFHWLAVPVGVGVLVAWNLLGWLMAGEFAVRWEALMEGRFLGRIAYEEGTAGHFATTEPHKLETFAAESPAFAWPSLILRLLGMSIVVPLFEELFIRSLMLRGLHRARTTGIGLVQMAQDMPVIGDWLSGTAVGEQAEQHPPVFGRQFLQTPLGQLSVFGVCASTLVFTISHTMRDWPGCIACGLAYCILLAATRHKGLGPVVWAHGITNALLWAYTLGTGDWQFM